MKVWALCIKKGCASVLTQPLDLIRTIISPSVSMTDGERIKIIVDLDNKLKENRDKMLDERARFNTVNDAIKRIAALKSTAKK